MTGSPCPRTRWLLVPLVAALLSPVGSPSARAGGPEPVGAAWRWPLEPPPRVVAGFDAPAGPYAAGHRGVDLSAVVGQEVLAAAAGTVAFAGTVAGRGVVSVDHADGRRTTYEPVTPSVRAGDPVAAGAVLGRVGTAPGHCLPTACLHWGVRRGEEYEDPLRLLGAAPVRLLPVWGSTWTLPPAGAAPVPRDGPEVEVGPAGRPERGPLLAGLGTGGWSEQ